MSVAKFRLFEQMNTRYIYILKSVLKYFKPATLPRNKQLK